MDALVTDVHIAAAVAGVRALGRTGLDVAGRSAPLGGGARSRYCARAIGPDSVIDPDGFIDAVRDVIERHGRLVVYPGQDEALNALRRAGHAGGGRAPLPRPRAARRAARQGPPRRPRGDRRARHAVRLPPPRARASIDRSARRRGRQAEPGRAGRSRTCG